MCQPRENRFFYRYKNKNALYTKKATAATCRHTHTCAQQRNDYVIKNRKHISHTRNPKRDINILLFKMYQTRKNDECARRYKDETVLVAFSHTFIFPIKSPQKRTRVHESGGDVITNRVLRPIHTHNYYYYYSATNFFFR